MYVPRASLFALIFTIFFQNSKCFRIERIQFDPYPPIPNEKLCIRPIFTLDSGHFVSKVTFLLLNNQNESIIYLFEQGTANGNGTITFPEKTFSQRIYLNDTQSSTICFHNVTVNDESLHFKWGVVIYPNDKSTEYYIDTNFQIKLGKTSEATTEIAITNVTVTPEKILPDGRFCLTLNFNIVSKNYYIKRLEFRIKNEVNTILYQVTNNSGTQNIIYASHYPWNVLIDKAQQKNENILCFEKMTPEIQKYTYYWHTVIENNDDLYDLKYKSFSFQFSPVSTDTKPTKAAKLSVGAIVGIVIAVVVIVVILIFIVVYKKNNYPKKTHKYSPPKEQYEDNKVQNEELKKMDAD